MSPATQDPNYPQPGFLKRLAAFMTSNIQSPNPAGSIVLQELLQGSQQVASLLLVSHVSTGAALLSILPGVLSAAHSALPVYIYIYIYIHIYHIYVHTYPFITCTLRLAATNSRSRTGPRLTDSRWACSAHRYVKSQAWAPAAGNRTAARPGQCKDIQRRSRDRVSSFR